MHPAVADRLGPLNYIDHQVVLVHPLYQLTHAMQHDSPVRSSGVAPAVKRRAAAGQVAAEGEAADFDSGALSGQPG